MKIIIITLYFHILFTTFVPQPCKKSIGKGKNAIVVEQRFLGFLYRRCTTALRKAHDQREYDSSDRTIIQTSCTTIVPRYFKLPMGKGTRGVHAER